MRNLKRFLALTLTMLMVVACFSVSASAVKFDDLGTDYDTAIDALSDLDVIKGRGDNLYDPDALVTREEMALLIAKLCTAKVTDNDYALVWNTEENYTKFVDLVNYYGAINYAANKGIIVGTTATTFEPTANITYQDALTMAVRALGYGSTKMDAGYPWTYIEKAEKTLGIKLSGVAYTEEITRAETAQILYDAFYAVAADGTVLATDLFGLQTVVVVANSAKTMIHAAKTTKTGYIGIAPILADGTISDMVYYLPAANFDGAVIGDSFKVTTADDFKTVGLVVACEKKAFTNEDITFAATAAADSANFTLFGVDYKAVNAFTALYNTQGQKIDRAEAFFYNARLAPDTYRDGSEKQYDTDAQGNILDTNGWIKYYYVPTITKSYSAPYATYDAATGVYTPVANAVIAADTAVNYAVTVAKYYETETALWANAASKNAYATGFAYDDDFDGIYERVIYKYQSFGKIFFKDTNGDNVADTYFAENYKITSSDVEYAAGDFCRFDTDLFTGETHVYEVYTDWQNGYVTGITGGKITVADNTMAIGGVAGLDNANAYIYTGNVADLIAKNIRFLVIEGKIYVVDALAQSVVVFDNFTGITTAGYATALAYVANPGAEYTAKIPVSNITIATIDGYSFQQYILKASSWSLKDIYSFIPAGRVFTGEKDSLGYWHLYTAETVKADPDVNDGVVSVTTGAKALIINLTEANDFVEYVGAKDVTTEKELYTKGNFTFVVEGTIAAPTAGPNNDPLKASCTADDRFDAIIYADARLVNSLTIGTDIGTGILFGHTYTYAEKALDMVTGKMVDVILNTAIYNCRLEAGKFYTVQNGYIEDEVKVGGDLIKVALLKYAKGNTTILVDAVVDDEVGNKHETNTDDCEVIVKGTAAKFNKISGGSVVLNTTGDAIGEATNYAAGFEQLVPVYYYAEAEAKSMSQVTLATAPTTNLAVEALTGLTEDEADELVTKYNDMVVFVVVDANGYTVVAKLVAAKAEDTTISGKAGYYAEDGADVQLYKVTLTAEITVADATAAGLTAVAGDKLAGKVLEVVDDAAVTSIAIDVVVK